VSPGEEGACAPYGMCLPEEEAFLRRLPEEYRGCVEFDGCSGGHGEAQLDSIEKRNSARGDWYPLIYRWRLITVGKIQIY
jgi:hypothetical protein